VREKHFDLLAITTRLRERRRFGEGPGDIACGLMDVAFDPSRWHFGAALRFEQAGTTLRHGAEILERVIGAASHAGLMPKQASVRSIMVCEADRIRFLAVTTAARADALPNIPTVGDFVPGYEVTAWYGIGAPKNTPTEIVDRLNKEINAGLADPGMKARLANLGSSAFPFRLPTLPSSSPTKPRSGPRLSSSPASRRSDPDYFRQIFHGFRSEKRTFRNAAIDGCEMTLWVSGDRSERRCGRCGATGPTAPTPLILAPSIASKLARMPWSIGQSRGEHRSRPRADVPPILVPACTAYVSRGFPDGVPGFGSLELTPELRRMVASLIGDAPRPATQRQGNTGRVEQTAEIAEPLPPPARTLAPAEDDNTAERSSARTGAPSGDAAAELVRVIPQDGNNDSLKESIGDSDEGPRSLPRKHGGAVPK
jgi:Tripartite tricarboxylate transporter family receptor